VLTGEGAAIDTTTASGKLVFGIFAALAEFERALISEPTVAGGLVGMSGPYWGSAGDPGEAADS
jgi:DNA invertase Pin-like site-specific DNA recombinase